MDLFIINRYRDDDVNEDINNQENIHLQRLKQKIDERKRACLQTPHSKADTISLKPQINNEIPVENDNIDNSKSKEDQNDKTSKKLPIDNEKKIQEFKVLGSSDFEKKAKVERVLPYWLSHSYSISKKLQSLTCRIQDQEWLHSILKTTLANEGVEHLFPVQEQVIPFILQEHKQPEPLWPHDVCVSAPTGSGKTLSFVIPIIQILMNSLGHHVRALVVLPVQELAIQVSKVFKKYCTNTGLKVALLSGSVPLQKEQQQIMRYTEISGWVSDVDILVCTAGRLVEHLQNTEGFSLKYLKFLVIDEADRIMDNIQNDWLYHLEKHIQLENDRSTKVPNLNWITLNSQKFPIHKLLFSATLSPDPELLEQWGLFQPKLFSAAPINDITNEKITKKYTTPDELNEQYIVCSTEEKPLILYHLIAELNWDKILCFTNSSQSAHRLTLLINNWACDKIKVAELSAALDRSKREVVLKMFKNSEINMIISTDALARGIDIPECSYVISYDPPRNIKTYIHRVGRTGRAGRQGNAVTILLQNQLQMFKEMLDSGAKGEIEQIHLESNKLSHLLEGYKKSITETKKIVTNEIQSKVKKSIELKRAVKSKPRKRKHNGIVNDNN